MISGGTRIGGRFFSSFGNVASSSHDTKKDEKKD